jgi:hypothetical protein
VKLHLKRWQVRGLALVISAVGVLTAIIDHNVLPLWVTFFAALFLSASLIKTIEPAKHVFLRRLVITTLALMMGVGAFNYVVNPFGLYPPHVFESIELNTRTNKMNSYAAYSSAPQIIVLGSSRSFSVDPTQIENLWHYSAFNASMAGALIQDYLAFLRYIEQAGRFPKIVIINLAPEVFEILSDLYIPEPNGLLWDYVDRADPNYLLKRGFDRVTRLFSKEQMETSIRVLQTKITKQSVFYPYTFDANGLGHFNVINLGADALAPNVLASNLWVTRFSQFHPEHYRFDQLQQILELAKEQHIQVIGYMPPYHPAMYKVLLERTDFTKIVNYISGQLATFEEEYPFHYVNFTGSDAFSDGDAMFYDIAHPSLQASALMMQQLYDQFHNELGAS